MPTSHAARMTKRRAGALWSGGAARASEEPVRLGGTMAIAVAVLALSVFYALVLRLSRLSPRAQAGTQLALQVRERLRQRPATLLLGEHLPIAQVAQQVDHEERIAFGPGVDQSRQSLREAVLGEFQGQIALNVVLAQ